MECESLEKLGTGRLNGERLGNFGRFMVGKDKTIFGVPYDQMAWFQLLRYSEEARACPAWSNSRYSKLRRWFRTTGELCLSSHRRVGEGVGASIGGWVLANMRAFRVDLYLWLCVHPKVRLHRRSYTRIHV